MRTLSIARANVRKLFAKLLGALWPPNALVVLRNAADLGIGRLKTSPVPPQLGDVDQLISAGVRWICHSQDVVGSGGVGSYDFSGWSTGYPEVTGYIIPTMWDCAQEFAKPALERRALQMTDWEVSLQRENGGWEGGNEGDGLPTVVFNTGQVLRGLLRSHGETASESYLHAARRAGDWMVAAQDADGSWTSANHLSLKRVYDSYVAAPLAELTEVTGDPRYADAARRNCDFVLSHQHPNGWFELCDNSQYFNDQPVTHTLCYTADGLFETGQRLGKSEYVDAAMRMAEALASHVTPHGYLPGRFDSDWRPAVRWVCLTGSAQLGVLLCRLHGVTGEERYLDIARSLARFLAHVQRLNGVGATRVGAIAGSYPIWGPYAPFRYPCWATKYFLDLLLGLRRARIPAAQLVAG